MTAEWFKIFSFIKCPIKYWTGISCPICGMTRAWLSFFMLDIEEAWHYHPLFWLPAVIVILLIFKDRISKSLFKGLIVSLVILLIGVYIVRLIWGDGSVVAINFKDGMIFKIIDLMRMING